MQRLFFCIAWKFSNRFLCSFLGNISTLILFIPWFISRENAYKKENPLLKFRLLRWRCIFHSSAELNVVCCLCEKLTLLLFFIDTIRSFIAVKFRLFNIFNECVLMTTFFIVINRVEWEVLKTPAYINTPALALNVP